MERIVELVYQDPVDMIWVGAAKELGMTIKRDSSVFATWDGESILTIGTPETLDQDDCLAQMILHEVCHWMVAGPAAFVLEDWGLEFGREDHEAHEFAALRLQCYLADQFGMRDFLGSTTDYREFYDRLSHDPLGLRLNASDLDGDPSLRLAQVAKEYCYESGVSNILLRAIGLTARIRDIVSHIADSSSLWRLR